MCFSVSVSFKSMESLKRECDMKERIIDKLL